MKTDETSEHGFENVAAIIDDGIYNPEKGTEIIGNYWSFERKGKDCGSFLGQYSLVPK